MANGYFAQPGQKMITRLGLAIFVMSLGVTLSASADDMSGGFVAKSPADIAWQAIPQLPGLSAMLIKGNPDEPGLYIMRVKFGPGVKSPPHHHDRDRFVTVIDGVWSFGIGEDFTCDDTVPLTAGSYAVHPKGAVHFDGSCGDAVIVEITGLGPVKTVFAEAPSE
jgi:quercetin dioxygenase-like cupin family protein